MDTIVALSTPHGKAAIAIIRVSGENSKKIIKLLAKKDNINPRYIYHGNIFDNDTIIDEVQFVYYEAPKSFTGEDSIEIFCHANEIIIEEIMNEIIKNGARLASKGEFTYRAYLNNKVDIIKAESISDIINSENKISLEYAKSNFQGKLQKYIEEIKTKIKGILEKTEIEIDFNDQDIEIYEENKIKSELVDIKSNLGILLSNNKNLSYFVDGIKIVICGMPNVGKSTLFNTILGEDIAITSPIPGTTRDNINKDHFLIGKKLKLIDTAGIRKPRGKIESIGIEKSIKAIKKSDLILLVVDAANKKTHNLDTFKNVIDKKKTIFVINKIDKINKVKTSKNQYFDEVKVSAKNGKIEELIKSIKTFIKVDTNLENLPYINKRQTIMIEKSLSLLTNSIKNIKKPDILSYELRSIWENLENILGKFDNEEILNSIFSKFCIGK